MSRIATSSGNLLGAPDDGRGCSPCGRRSSRPARWTTSTCPRRRRSPARSRRLTLSGELPRELTHTLLVVLLGWFAAATLGIALGLLLGLLGWRVALVDGEPRGDPGAAADLPRPGRPAGVRLLGADGADDHRLRERVARDGQHDRRRAQRPPGTAARRPHAAPVARRDDPQDHPAGRPAADHRRAAPGAVVLARARGRRGGRGQPERPRQRDRQRAAGAAPGRDVRLRARDRRCSAWR